MNSSLKLFTDCNLELHTAKGGVASLAARLAMSGRIYFYIVDKVLHRKIRLLEQNQAELTRRLKKRTESLP